MRKLKSVIVVCMIGIGINACSESENPPSSTEQVAWGYEEENGPDVWGELNPDYALCAEGTLQSPIDLVDPVSAELSDILFNYRPVLMDIHNNGHTIEVAPTEVNRIEVDGTEYELLQFHFHAPSEHTVAGRSFDMEMHLVHRNEEGTLAVIGVLIERGNDNAAFNTLWAHLPDTPGATNRIEDAAINADDLLPSDRQTYRYDGSLTTPPCSEGVKWFVLTMPIEFSDTQMAEFQAIVHNNNRPTQPLNGRELLVNVANGD